jgi:hypothetical protein
MNESKHLEQVRRLVRRVDELELSIARIHRVCAVELGLLKRRGLRRKAKARKEKPGNA